MAAAFPSSHHAGQFLDELGLPIRGLSEVAVSAATHSLHIKRKMAVRKMPGIIVLTGPKRRSERNGGIRRPGRLVAFMRIRRVTDAWLSRCRL